MSYTCYTDLNDTLTVYQLIWNKKNIKQPQTVNDTDVYIRVINDLHGMTIYTLHMTM
jgi:hypothetical protein